MAEKRISKKLLNVRPSGIRRMFDLSQGIPDIISLGIGQPDFDTPEYIKNAMKKALDDKYTSYSPNMGYVELREEIVKKYRETYDLNYSINDIIVTCGGCEALYIIFQALIGQGDEVLIPDPGFLTYHAQTILAGGKPVPYLLDENNDFKIDYNNLKSKITSKTKMIVLNFPSNPTGTVMTESELSEIIDLIIKKDLFILSDEVYEKLIYDGLKHTAIPTLGVKDRTFLVNSFSKSHAMTGWRVGYLLGPSEYIPSINLVHQMNTASANSAAQIACVEALKNKEESDKFEKMMVEEFDRRRKFFYTNLNKIDGLKCNLVKGAFYVMVNIEGTGLSSTEFSELMIKKARVAMVPGNEFGEAGEGYVRVAYTTSIKNLEQALERIKNALY